MENYIFTCGKCERKYSFVGYKTDIGKNPAQLKQMEDEAHMCRQCGHDDRQGGPKNKCELDWGDNSSTAVTNVVAEILKGPIPDEPSQDLSWDQYFLNIVKEVSKKSKDRSTKVGAIIVGPDHQIVSTGFNGFPIGVNDDVEERHQRPAKYDWTEHAERNAIYLAARKGTPLEGCTLYLMYSPAPCVRCARGIIQVGIKEIVVSDDDWAGNLDCEFDVAIEMLKEAHVTIRKAK